MEIVYIFLGAGLMLGAICVAEARAISRDLDRVGRSFGVLRWEGESSKNYADRIKNRIAITGGKRVEP